MVDLTVGPASEEPEPVPVPGLHETPLRDEVTGAVLAYLRDGMHVDLVGLRGSGRSTVLHRVAERLATSGRPVVRLSGVRALQDRPLAALALTVVPAAHPTALASAVDALQQQITGAAALLVDDADDLDVPTVGAVLAAQARTGVPVLTVSRPESRRAADPRSLAAALVPGARVTLAPLGFEDVHLLVHRLLGDAVEPTAVARVAALSGGLPGLVTATVDAARRADRLVHRDGLWVVRGELWCPALGATVEPLLLGLGDEAVEAATVLALAGGTPLPVARRLVDPATLHVLDDRGLIAVRGGGDDPVLELFPPLLEQHLTREGPALSTALARERLATVDRGLAAGARDRSRVAPGVDGGQQLARHWVHRVRDLRRRWAQEPSPGLAVDLLESLSVTAASRWELDEVADHAATLPGSPRDRAALAAWTARFRAVTSGQIDPALDVLAPVRGTVPGYEAVLRAAEGQARLAVGVLPLGTVLDPPVAEDCEEARDALALARAAGALAAGRPGDAVTLVEAVQGRCPQAAVLRGLALLLDGDPAAGVQVARAGMDRAQEAADPVLLHEHAYVASYGLALQGRVDELHELTSAVLALGVVPQHRPQEVGSLLTFAAMAAHWQSRHDYARSVATQAGARPVPRGPSPFMAADLVGALLQDGADGTGGAEALWAAARERLEAGFLPAGVALGVHAVERDPRAERAAVLVEAAAAGGSVLLRHLAAYAWALAAGSAEGLAQQETSLGTVGLGQYAVRAAVACSLRMMAEGNPREAVAHADAAWGRAGLRGRDLCGLFRPLDRAVRVTPREREVAVLVARGWSTPEIAARMVLSVRTVESHVFSACHKVGADGREGLARVAQTWLTCTPP